MSITEAQYIWKAGAISDRHDARVHNLSRGRARLADAGAEAGTVASRAAGQATRRRRQAWRRAADAAVLLCSVSAAACGRGDSGPPAATSARDSAGVRIVESRGELWGRGAGWTVEATPTVSIGGGSDGEEADLLGVVRSAMRLDDGRILVLDDSPARRIRVFDAAGHLLEYWGGAGGARGEFGLAPVALIPDPAGGIVVPELDAQRIHRFHADGTFRGRAVPLHDHEVDPRERVTTGTCCAFLDVLPDGRWLLAYPEEGLIPGTGPRRGERVLMRYSVLGVPDGELVRYPGGLWRDGGPNDRAPITLLPLSGDVTTAVAGEEVFIGNGAAWQVDVYGAQGEHRRSLRVEREPPHFDAAHRAAYIEQLVAAISRAQGADAAARRRADLEADVPARLPAYSRILVDPAGNVWLVAYAATGLPEPPATVALLDVDGRMLGDVRLPAGLRPLQVGDDWILGATTDAQGVHRVVVHSIVKPAQ